MYERLRKKVTAIFRVLPGWLYITAGAALIACVLVTKAWLDCRRLAWQRDLLKLENQLLAQHEASYEQFHAALESGDPVLLERLAYLHLRMVPQGCQPLNTLDDPAIRPVSAPNPSPLAQQLQLQNPDLFTVELADLPADRSEEDFYRHMDLIVHDPALLPYRSTLVRLATGPKSRLLLGLGVMFLTAGLIPPGSPGSPRRPGSPEASCVKTPHPPSPASHR